MPDVSPAESSPAIEVPRGAERAEWLKTGKLPEPKPESPADSKRTSEKSAPASEAGNPQDKSKPRDNASTRLNELLEDLKRAGLSPSELKTFKREAQQQQQKAESPKETPEQTAKPAELKAPVKPNPNDFKKFDEYEAAKDQYYEDLTDFKAANALESFRREQADTAAQQTLHQKMTEAATRYGAESVEIIKSTASALTGDKQIPGVITQMLNDSPVWTDLLYTLGGTPADLDAFIGQAKSDPRAAIAKIVLMEQLVVQELAKGSKSGESGAAADRDDTGKFVPAKKTPETRKSDAPPPPREVSGRGAAPPNEAERAVKDGDFSSFKRAEDAKELARRKR